VPIASIAASFANASGQPPVSTALNDTESKVYGAKWSDDRSEQRLENSYFLPASTSTIKARTSRIIYGVHANGANDRNSGTRIDQTKYEVILNWKSKN
jgi:hypothetical protein